MDMWHDDWEDSFDPLAKHNQSGTAWLVLVFVIAAIILGYFLVG